MILMLALAVQPIIIYNLPTTTVLPISIIKNVSELRTVLVLVLPLVLALVVLVLQSLVFSAFIILLLLYEINAA